MPPLEKLAKSEKYIQHTFWCQNEALMLVETHFSCANFWRSSPKCSGGLLDTTPRVSKLMPSKSLGADVASLKEPFNRVQCSKIPT